MNRDPEAGGKRYRSSFERPNVRRRAGGKGGRTLRRRRPPTLLPPERNQDLQDVVEEQGDGGEQGHGGRDVLVGAVVAQDL